MRSAIIKVITMLLFSLASVAFATELAPHEKTCAELGFKRKTPAFGECVLELFDREKTQQKNMAQEQQRRNEAEEKRRAAELAARGDGSPEHGMCVRYGFTPGATSYAECRQKIDIAKAENAHRQRLYERQQREYQEHLVEYKRERERRQGEALLRFGAALAGGTSSNFSENFGNAGRASLGMEPQPPRMAPSQPQTFTIRTPDGRMTNCTYLGDNINCF
jgi:hypothetical protein